MLLSSTQVLTCGQRVNVGDGCYVAEVVPKYLLGGKGSRWGMGVMLQW